MWLHKIIEFNELSQHSPIERIPGDVLAPLGDAWGLSARTDPLLALLMSSWGWGTLVVAALGRAMLPRCHLWQCLFLWLLQILPPYDKIQVQFTKVSWKPGFSLGF